MLLELAVESFSQECRIIYLCGSGSITSGLSLFKSIRFVKRRHDLLVSVFF